jgi:hypothetical protein
MPSGRLRRPQWGQPSCPLLAPLNVQVLSFRTVCSRYEPRERRVCPGFLAARSGTPSPRPS